MNRSTDALPAVKGKETAAPDACRLVALVDYCPPSMPAEHAIRAVLRRFKKRIFSVEDDPMRADNRLKATTQNALDEVVALPAFGPFLDDFDHAVRTWLEEPDSTFHCVVVLPPCDAGDVLGTWAQLRGYTVVRAPARGQGHGMTVIPPQVVNTKSAAGDEVGGAPQPPVDALLVIPQLESWFLRRRHGLEAVRALLSELQRSDRRCLIGCNSWAWAFLVRAAGAALVLPSPRTFAAVDAQRLQAWFAQLATRSGSDRMAFRLASNGADVLQTHSDGSLVNSYLKELAARSHGIPWVAWHLWRKALRTGMDATTPETVRRHSQASDLSREQDSFREDAVKKSHSGVDSNERTFWIKSVPDPSLPHDRDDNALLVLHALLIHGALSTAELLSVLPDATAAEVLPALLRAGFIAQGQSQLSLEPAAYPVVRRLLVADGFPTGAL